MVFVFLLYGYSRKTFLFLLKLLIQLILEIVQKELELTIPFDFASVFYDSSFLSQYFCCFNKYLVKFPYTITLNLKVKTKTDLRAG
ncbi:hypothetical protein CMK14_03735 [Candidatus Poribacteria bacterium]|nr:hypothetical protein [Candidatus Poribacteria bacterium]